MTTSHLELLNGDSQNRETMLENRKINNNNKKIRLTAIEKNIFVSVGYFSGHLHTLHVKTIMWEEQHPLTNLTEEEQLSRDGKQAFHWLNRKKKPEKTIKF